MKRWWLLIALLLSVGLNLGWLGRGLWHQHQARSQQELLAELERESLSQQTSAEVAVSVPADPDPRRAAGSLGAGHMPRILERMADELRLEGEEREEFSSLQRKYFRRAFQGRRALARLQQDVRLEILQADPDRRLLDRLLRQISEAQLVLEQDFVDHILDSRQLLDGPRERRFLRMMARWRKHRGQLQGHRGETRRWPAPRGPSTPGALDDPE